MGRSLLVSIPSRRVVLLVQGSYYLLALAAGSAAALAGIDLVYVARRRISPRYLADAAVQVGLLCGLAAGE